jgi:cell division protein FtsB
MGKTHRLRNIKLREVSLVDDPANPGAHVVLYKSGAGGIREKIKDFIKNLPSNIGGRTKAEELLNELLVPDSKETEMTEAEIKKLQDDLAAADKKATDAEAAAKTAADAAKAKETELTTKVDDLTKSNTELVAKVADLEKTSTDEVLKVGGQEIRKSKVGDEVFKAMKVQQDMIDKGKATAELVECAKRAETEYPNLPGKPEEKAKILQAIDAMPEADRAPATAALKAGDAAIAELTKAKGRSPSAGGGTTAEEKLTQKAREIQKADDKLSFADAYDKALEQNPELYEQYETEKKQRAA